MKVKENNTTVDFHKKSYIEAIDNIMARCDDIVLINLVYQLLVKSEIAANSN